MPQGVAVDGAGNMYVTERYSHTVRKVTPSGKVTTWAGHRGARGFADGPGAQARFDNPDGVAVDAAGNVYVADGFNHTIRKISPVGEVTTWAGQAGEVGSADGFGADARFDYPSGVATDSAGNVYVADGGNHTIRKIAPTGEVTTLAGRAGEEGNIDGLGSDARFSSPYGLAVDSSGNVFVADSRNHTLRKIEPSGEVTTVAGLAGARGSVDGTGFDARFSFPSGVVADTAGNVYVTDWGADIIRKVTPAGEVTTLAGTADQTGFEDGVGAASRWASPVGISIDVLGNLYVADVNNHTVRQISSAGVVTTWVGRAAAPGSTDGIDGRLNGPVGVTVDSFGNVYVADRANHTIRKVALDGVITTWVGRAGARGAADGQGSDARFFYPMGVAIDTAGTVYVADTDNRIIRKVTAAGEVTTVAGSSTAGGATDGVGRAARFSAPTGMATDAVGNVYVADTDNHTIRKMDAFGVVTTLAGRAGVGSFGDGTGVNARFHDPRGVATDAAGNVYVADSNNFTVRKVTPGGEATTLAGTSEKPGTVDGAAGVALFVSPQGVAVDAAGFVYVIDGSYDETFEYSLIRKVAPDGTTSSIKVALPSARGIAIRDSAIYLTVENAVVMVAAP